MALSPLIALLLTFFAPPLASAQLGATASIQGTVTDASGALVPGATVVARHIATGIETRGKTTSDGYYVLSALPAGTYSVTVTAPGFETLVQENIVLNGLQQLGLNLVLQVGRATQSVTVTAAPPQLETTNATLGGTLDNHMYQDLPLEMGSAGNPDQRRATDFAMLMPGVSAQTLNGNLTDIGVIVNGSSPWGVAVEMYIEGVPFTSASGQGDPRDVWTSFSVDAINQFQVKTNGYGAEYQGMGFENFTIKAGTNEIHGSAYDYLRNTIFDTWGFLPPLNAATGQTYKPPEHQNEYGITLGGPLWKNHLFLFTSYNGYRYTSITKPQYQTDPTTAMMGGDFTALLSANGGPGITLYDPTTTSCNAAGNACTRQPIMGLKNGVPTPNVIPAGEISPIAQYLQNFLPPLTNQNLTNNYLGSYAYGLSNWSNTDRLDWTINNKQNLTFLFSVGRQASVPLASNTTNEAPLPYADAKIYAPLTHVYLLEHTWQISPMMVNQIKLGAGQYHSPDYNPTYGITNWEATSAGITGLPAGQAANGFPELTFSGTDNQAQMGTQNAYVGSTNADTLLDNVQWLHGKHAFTFGAQEEWLQYNYTYSGTGTSPVTLAFSPNETANFKASSTSVASNTGYSYASFLLGAVDSSSFSQYAVQETGSRFHDFSVYAQDDYKVLPKLTLNLGLRWDLMPPFREVQNRFSFLNATETNPVTGNPGALEFAGHGPFSCNCSTPVDTYYRNFGPRIGVAYEVTPRTVVRSSFDILYVHGGGVGGSANSEPNTVSELGYSTQIKLSSSKDALPVFYLNNGPTFTSAGINNTQWGGNGYTFLPAPFINSAYGTYYSTAAVSPYKVSTTMGYMDPVLGGRSPEYITWAGGIQQMLTRNMNISVNYVGNQGHFLGATSSGGGAARGYWNNEIQPGYLSLGSQLSNTANAANDAAAGIALPYATFNNTIAQALRPFPQYNGVNDLFGQVSNSNYNAMQLQLIQRPTNGLSFMVNYTYSRNIDDAGTFRSGYAIPASALINGTRSYPVDRIERSRSNADQPQQLAFLPVYDLPFGKGHIGGDNAVLRSLDSGWTFSSIFSYYSGLPLALTETTSANSCANLPDQGTCMPSYNPGFSGSARQNGGWGHGATSANLATISYVNSGAFLSTTQLENYGYLIGNVARTGPDNLRAPSVYNLDASLRRAFPLFKESWKLLFEADCFNVTNHVQFGSGSTNGAASIGQTVGSSNFGVPAGQANNTRAWQFSGRISF
ncbi:MAG: TonB-dependent receptor [Acidobacteriaceae bacterium]